MLYLSILYALALVYLIFNSAVRKKEQKAYIKQLQKGVTELEEENQELKRKVSFAESYFGKKEFRKKLALIEKNMKK